MLFKAYLLINKVGRPAPMVLAPFMDDYYAWQYCFQDSMPMTATCQEYGRAKND